MHIRCPYVFISLIFKDFGFNRINLDDNDEVLYQASDPFSDGSIWESAKISTTIDSGREITLEYFQKNPLLNSQ